MPKKTWIEFHSGRNGGRKGDPQGYAGEADHHFDAALDEVVDDAAQVAGNEPDYAAQDKAERDADKADCQGDASTVQELGKEVAALRIGAQQEELARAFDAEQVTIPGKSQEAPTLLCLHEEAKGVDLLLIGHVEPAQCLRITFLFEAVDEGAQAEAAIRRDEADELRRHVEKAGVAFVERVGRGQFGRQDQRVEQEKGSRAYDTNAVAFETPPDKAPVGKGGRLCSARRRVRGL